MPLQWEALKSVLRDTFIKHGTCLKRERAAKLKDLLETISRLEGSHKLHPSADTWLALFEARQSTLQLLNQKSLHMRDIMRRMFYEAGDKPGRLLVRALHSQNSLSRVPRIRKSTGQLAVPLKLSPWSFLSFTVNYTR